MDISRGADELQRQILDQIRLSMRLLGADTASFHRFDAAMRPSTQALNLLNRELERLGANRELLGAVGSWGDTLAPESVLDLLKDWNEAEQQIRQKLPAA